MNVQPKTTADKSQAYGVMAVVLLLGLAIRVWFSTMGHNYDLESYKIVAGLTEQGKNVYASTDRYNYGPVWFNVLHVLDLIAGHNPDVFRWLIIGVLSAADAGISWILWRKFSRPAAVLFFLNPVSMMITGYHNQFDNVAILLGLWSVLLYGEDFEKPVDRRKFCGLLVLALSLMTKHLLFVFPLWLAVKQKGLLQKCVVLGVPVAIFLLGFAPYWADGRQGIIDHVFLYRSLKVAFFYNFFVPGALQPAISPQTVWLLMLFIFAFICRRRSGMESLLIYTAVMVATAPATMNQYLAIPSAFTSVFVNYFTVLYTVVTTLHIAMDLNGPHLMSQIPGIGSGTNLTIYCLFIAIGWTLWHESWVKFANKCLAEVKGQFTGGTRKTESGVNGETGPSSRENKPGKKDSGTETEAT